MSVNTLLLCATEGARTKRDMPKKQNHNGLAELLLLLLVVFLEGTRLFSSLSLAFTYVKELELPAIKNDTYTIPR